MATLPSLCEVSYDPTGFWEETWETPYRCRSLSSARHRFPRQCDTSASFYDSHVVGSRTPVSFSLPGRPNTIVSTYSNYVMPSRANTLPPGAYTFEYSHENKGEGGGKWRDGRVRTAGPITLPLVNRDRNCAAPTTGTTSYGLPSYLQDGQEEENSDRVTWIPSLNTWVTDKSQNPVPYLSFVNTASLQSRGVNSDGTPIQGDLPILPCDRFLAHMHMHEETAKSLLDHRILLRERKLQHELERKVRSDLAKTVAVKSPTKVRFIPAPRVLPRALPPPVREIVRDPSPDPSYKAVSYAWGDEGEEDLGEEWEYKEEEEFSKGAKASGDGSGFEQIGAFFGTKSSASPSVRSSAKKSSSGSKEGGSPREPTPPTPAPPTPPREPTPEPTPPPSPPPKIPTPPPPKPRTPTPPTDVVKVIEFKIETVAYEDDSSDDASSRTSGHLPPIPPPGRAMVAKKNVAPPPKPAPVKPEPKPKVIKALKKPAPPKPVSKPKPKKKKVPTATLR